MECGTNSERISALLDGELAPEEEAELRAHVAGCAACSAEVASLEGVKRAAVRVAESARVPRGFWRGVARRLDEVDGRAAAPRRWVVRPLPVVGAAAVVLALATAIGLWMTPTKPSIELAAVAQDFVQHEVMSAPRYDAEPGAIQSAFSGQLGGRPVVMADFPRAEASLQGGRLCTWSGVPAVAQVYATSYGIVTLYQMGGENVKLPREAIEDAEAGRLFYVFSAGGCNVVAWRYGELVMALAGQVSVPDLIGMAREMVPTVDVGI